MFKNILLKIANKVINKYGGVHIIDVDSIIQIPTNKYFKYKIYNYSMSYNYYNSTLKLEGIDIMNELK